MTHNMKMKQFIFTSFIVLIFSCNGHEESIPDVSNDTMVAVEHPDTSMARFYRQVMSIETSELQQFGKLNRIAARIISVDEISATTYYEERKEELVKAMPVSSNKEKTSKAIAYLENILAKQPKFKIYKVKFHLEALLANKTTYNEEHIKYLKEDLTEVKLVFPG